MESRFQPSDTLQPHAKAMLVPWLTDKTQQTLTPTPLPERERGFEPSVTFLVSLLPLWEKGLRDEGARFCESTRLVPSPHLNCPKSPTDFISLFLFLCVNNATHPKGRLRGKAFSLP